MQILPTALGGFNPGVGKVFVPARSRIASWLGDPAQGPPGSTLVSAGDADRQV